MTAGAVSALAPAVVRPRPRQSQPRSRTPIAVFHSATLTLSLRAYHESQHWRENGALIEIKACRPQWTLRVEVSPSAEQIS
jgi:hypothetical protein